MGQEVERKQSQTSCNLLKICVPFHCERDSVKGVKGVEGGKIHLVSRVRAEDEGREDQDGYDEL